MTPWPIIAVLVLVALAIVVLVVRRLLARRLDPAARRTIGRAWQSAVHQKDPVRQILEADKALDIALAACGFRGSLGDKLKAAGPRLRDLDAVWRAHKLRNHLAHEAHATATSTDADRALAAFKRGIEDVIGGRIDA